MRWFAAYMTGDVAGGNSARNPSESVASGRPRKKKRTAGGARRTPCPARSLSRLESKLKEAREEAAASKDEARRARSEVESLRKNVKSNRGAHDSLLDLHSKLGASDDELLKLKVRLREVEGNLHSTERARARLEETLAGANAEAESLRSHLDASTANGGFADSGHRELRDRIEDLQRRATRAETDAAELRAKLRTSEVAERECEWLKQKLREVTADYTALQEFARRMRSTKRTPSASPDSKAVQTRRSSSRGPSPAKRRTEVLARELQEERVRHSAEVASLEQALRQASADPGRRMSERELNDARYGQRLRDVVGGRSQGEGGGVRRLHSNGAGGAFAVARNSVQGPTGSHRLAAVVRDGGEYPFPELSDTTDDDMPAPVYLAELDASASRGRNGDAGGTGKSSRQGSNRWQQALGKLKPRQKGSKEQQSSP